LISKRRKGCRNVRTPMRGYWGQTPNSSQ
jgi:hypothetical protein